MPKTALITDVTGQYGAYLSKFLLKKGYIAQSNNSDLKLNNSQVIVEVDPDYFRPTGTDMLIGDE